MRKTILLLVVLLLGGLLAGPAAADPPGRGHAHGTHDPGLGAQLAEVRAATARYHDVSVAEADGYVDPGAEHCVHVPALGAMGYHFANVGYVGPSGELDPTTPQVLLYVPGANGKLQLAGVEYISFAPSTVLGQALPFIEDHPALGDHYALHVWVWQNNPAGMFADFNPRLSC